MNYSHHHGHDFVKPENWLSVLDNQYVLTFSWYILARPQHLRPVSSKSLEGDLTGAPLSDIYMGQTSSAFNSDLCRCEKILKVQRTQISQLYVVWDFFQEIMLG